MRKYLCYLALTMLIFGCFLLYVFHHHQKTDAQPPKIAFSDQTLALSVHDPKSMLLQGVTATDNVDGDVTASLVVASIQLLDKSGNIQVTYAAFDAAGNAAKAVRQARYTDYQSPRFCVQQSLTFAYNSSFNLLRLIQAQDILDGDISHRIRTISLDDSSLSTLGTHYVELKVSNTLGETAKLVIPVEVYESGLYDATVTLTDYLIYMPVGGTLAPESYLEEYIRAGSAVALWETLPEGYAIEIENNVQPDVPGVYTISYWVTQTVGTGANAKSHTGYAKLIVVVEG